MKRLLILASLLGILISSCSKKNDADVGSSVITGVFDGKSFTFNTDITATHFNAPGYFTILIEARQYIDTVNQGFGIYDFLTMQIGSKQPNAAGTYSENSTDSSNEVTRFGYFKVGNAYSYGNHNSQANPITIDITKISSTSIQGTFKGDVYSSAAYGITPTTKAFTNGKFYIKF